MALIPQFRPSSINLVSGAKMPSAVLIADTALFYAPVDAQADYAVVNALGIQLGEGTLPPTLTQVVNYRNGLGAPINPQPQTVSAALEINSAKGGLLNARMTTGQRNLLIPTNGMQIYNISTDSLDVFIAGNWMPFSQGGGDVVGPAGAVPDNIATFADNTGLVIKDSGAQINQGGVLTAATNLAVGNQITSISTVEFVTSGVNQNDCAIGLSIAPNGSGVYLARLFRTLPNGLDGASIVFSSDAFGVIAPTSPNAIIEINSTDSTFLNARMTTIQMLAIAAPAMGMQVYVTDISPGLYYYNGANWVQISSGGSSSFPYREFGAVPNVSLYMGTGFNLAATGARNIGIGDGSLQGLVNGSDNICIGVFNATSFINNCNQNVLIGSTPNFVVPASMTDCIFIGSENGFLSSNMSNRIIIGNQTTCNTDNSMVIGGLKGSASYLKVGIGTQNPVAALHVNGSQALGFTRFISSPIDGVITSNYSVFGQWDYCIPVNTTGGAVTITLPASAGFGQMFIIKDVGGAANTNFIDINPNGRTIDGRPATLSMTISYASLTIYSDGTNYFSISGTYVPLPTSFIFQDTGGSLDNLFLGINGGNYATTGTNNFAAGYNSLVANTTGFDNVAIGTNALQNNTTGIFNVAIGSDTLTANVSSQSNVAIGPGALRNTTAGHNVAIGAGALSNNVSGTVNVGIGFSTLSALTSGSSNIAIGDTVLAFNITGSNNIGIGADSLALTTGSDNIGIGFASLNQNAGGNQNLGLGSYSLLFLATGDNNVVLGYRSMNNLANGSNNLGLGNLSLENVTGGSDNIGIGFESLQALVSGNHNVSLGDGALASLTNGDNNVAFGFEALATISIGSNNFAVGYQALMSLGNGSSGNGALGYRALASLVSGNNNAAIGNAAVNIVGGDGNLAIGQGALGASTGSPNDNLAIGLNALSLSTGNSNIAIGSNASSSLTTSNDSIAIGDDALLSTTTGISNVGIGTQALASNVTGQGNTAIGAFALRSCLGDSSVAIGNGALYSSTIGGMTAIGDQALFANTTGTSNLAVGLGSLSANLIGSNNLGVGEYSLAANLADLNLAIGADCLRANTTGTQNLGVGFAALNANVIGNNNTAIGFEALLVSTGDNNLAIGSQSYTALATGGDNVAIGQSSGLVVIAGSKSVVIGSNAMASLVTSSNGNTIIGEGTAGTPTTTLKNVTLLGNGADCADGISNSAAIGANSFVGADSCLVLGGTGLAQVNVGIGVTIPLATLHVVGGQIVNTVVATTPYDVQSTDYTVFAPTSSTPVTPFSVVLPNPDTNNATAPNGQVFYIKDTGGNATLNNITIDAGLLGVLIDGASTYVINSDYGSVRIISDGTNYFIT